MKHYEMNVREFVNELQARWYDSSIDQLGIVDEKTSEYSVLCYLDEARKRLDEQLTEGMDVPGLLESAVSRICLNSLRKFGQPIKLDGKFIEGTSPSINNALIDGHNTDVDVRTLTWFEYSDLLASNAVEGFIRRNKEVQWKPPAYLIPGMKKFLNHALQGFQESFASAEGHYGPGAVAEGLTQFQRWELTGFNPYWSPRTEDYTVYDLPSSTEVRLCAVDKDWNKKRLITVEPYENTYLQHKIRHALSRTLVRNGLAKLASQSDSHIDIPAEHRRLCLESSVYAERTARIDTFDLSDASDSISWSAVIEVFPLDVVVELERARTPYFRADSRIISEKPDRLFADADRSVESLEMRIYAGMGNATTFLVEGLYFYALLQAAAEYHRVPTAKARVISVFGDDLITPTGYHEVFMSALENAGLKLNEKKSFWGNCDVRESCGMWAYRGQNLYVLPYRGYPKTPEGALGFAEYIRNSSIVTRAMCLSCVKNWPNTDREIPNTISVVDPDRPVSWELSRWSSKLCGTEWKLKTAHTSHRLHLCVRRGGAYMMISRVPSQEGITETVPLIEVLSQRGSIVNTHVGKVVEVCVKPPRRRISQEKRPMDRSCTNSEHTRREVIITLELVKLCRFVRQYQLACRMSTPSRALLRLLSLRAKVVKPCTADEREAVRMFRSLLSASRSNIPSLRLLLLGTIGVLKEAIPHSTTLRSSWVSYT